jgi:peptidyl-prolyl cis-trans isomerase SurA
MIQVRSSLALACLAGFVVSTACGRSEEAPKPVAANVAAVVDSTQITQEDVDRTYRLMFPGAPNAPGDAEVMTQKLSALEELINQEILLGRARAAGLQASDAEVEAAFTDRRSGMAEDVYQKQLTERGLTTDDVKRGIRRELTIQKLLDRDVTSKVNVTDEDIASYYNQHRAQFNVAEPQYRVAQIVVTPERNEVRNRLNDDATTPAEAKRKVDMLLERLRGGTDFGALAMDYSEDPQSGPQGGDLGFVPVSALDQAPPAMKQVVMQTQPGRVSVATVGGNSILVVVLAREPAGQRELSSPGVKDTIRDMLTDQRQQLLRSAYMAAARNEAEVENAMARRIVEAQSKPAAVLPAAPGKQ